MPLSFPADSTFDSGQGSTVYSDSQSSQQSVVLGSLADTAPPPAQCVCSPPVSLSDGPVLPYSLPAVGPYQQPAVVSQPPAPVPWSPTGSPGHAGLWSGPGEARPGGTLGTGPERPIRGEARSPERSAWGLWWPALLTAPTPLISTGVSGPAEGASVRVRSTRQLNCGERGQEPVE